MTRFKSWVAWSSGKDSAWALHLATTQGSTDVVGLLTTVTDAFGRVSMHGVREELLRAQAEALGLPLHVVRIPSPCSNAAYDVAMEKALASARAAGVSHVVFGDLFLEDVRAYREERLARVGMSGVFPLWGLETRALARDMIRAGLRAHIVCLDPARLPARFAGRAFDESLLRDLPANVDPCGENGEFHTFASSGPGFSHPVPVAIGETVSRDGFLFTELTPGT